MSEFARNDVQLDAGAIEPGLRAEWERAEHESSKPLSRTLTLNVIAVAHAKDALVVRAAVHAMLGRHPCRAFLLLLDDGQVDELEVRLGTVVRNARRNRQLRLEQITIRCPHSQQIRLPSLVRPLLVDDLQTLVFWADSPGLDPDLFGVLANMADRVVVDSSLMRDPASEFAQLRGADWPISDLAWLRCKPWRRSLAEAFETFEWRPGQATDVRLVRRPTPGAIGACLHLSHWFGERLSARVTIEDAVDADRAPSMQPAGLELQHGDMHVAVEHLYPERCLRVSISDRSRCALPFRAVASGGTRGDLLAVAADTC